MVHAKAGRMPGKEATVDAWAGTNPGKESTVDAKAGIFPGEAGMTDSDVPRIPIFRRRGCLCVAPLSYRFALKTTGTRGIEWLASRPPAIAAARAGFPIDSD
jgi:hypothetical protein